MAKHVELKKDNRGAIVEKVTIIDGTKVSVVTWYDNKLVDILWAYDGNMPTVAVSRFSKSDKTHIILRCPYAMTIYNKYMEE